MFFKNFFAKPSPCVMRVDRVLVAHCTVEVESKFPFLVLMPNFNYVSVFLPKNMAIAHLESEPTASFPTPLTMASLTRGFDLLDSDDDERHITELLVADTRKFLQLQSTDYRILIKTLKNKGITAGDNIYLSKAPSDMRDRIQSMLQAHSILSSDDLGAIEATEHHVEMLCNTRPIPQAPRRSGLKQRDIVQKHIYKMMHKGVILPIKIVWASPVVLVPKADGSIRLCVDYRRVNAVTKRDAYPFPRLNDCIDSLGEAK